MRLSDVLDAKPHRVVSLALTATVAEAAALMKREVVGALVISETWGRYRGMLSERNLAVAIAQHGRDLFKRRAGELMWANAPTATRDMSIPDAIQLMREKRVRHLPVLDHGKVLGVISLGDLLQHHCAERAAPADVEGRRLAA